MELRGTNSCILHTGVVTVIVSWFPRLSIKHDEPIVRTQLVSEGPRDRSSQVQECAGLWLLLWSPWEKACEGVMRLLAGARGGEGLLLILLTRAVAQKDLELLAEKVIILRIILKVQKYFWMSKHCLILTGHLCDLHDRYHGNSEQTPSHSGQVKAFRL